MLNKLVYWFFDNTLFISYLFGFKTLLTGEPSNSHIFLKPKLAT